MLFEELLNKFQNKTNKLTALLHSNNFPPYRLPKLTCKTFESDMFHIFNITK